MQQQNDFQNVFGGYGGMMKINIKSLKMQETGTYNPMVIRPYSTYIDNNCLGRISDRISAVNGGQITGAIMAGLANNILQPATTPQGVIDIPYGWAERRIRFILEVVCQLPIGSEVVYYFQGYTSHLGISHNGNVDPNMQFYINSFIKVVRCSKYTAIGMVTEDVVTESANIVNGKINYTSRDPNESLYMMRPNDIFCGIQANYLNNALSNQRFGSVEDTRFKLNNDPVRSDRVNNLSTNYLAKLVDTYQLSLRTSMQSSDSQDVFNNCVNNTYEENINTNPFIQALSNIKGMPSCAIFQMNDLRSIDPNVDNVSVFATLGTTVQNVVHTTGQTESWNSVNIETVLATMLSNAVPALMMELMISKIGFRATNGNIGGQHTVLLYDAKSLTNADMSAYYELFKRRLEKEVLVDISQNNNEIYAIDMYADMFGESRINISIGGQAMVPYTTPSFCDSLMTPVVAVNKSNFNYVVHDFETLMNVVTETVSKGNGSSINLNI